MTAIQINVGSTSQEYSMPLTLSPTYNIHHGVLCLVRVYALYGRSRRILGFLVLLSAGSVVTSLVGRLLLTPMLMYACLNRFFIIYQGFIILNS